MGLMAFKQVNGYDKSWRFLNVEHIREIRHGNNEQQTYVGYIRGVGTSDYEIYNITVADFLKAYFKPINNAEELTAFLLANPGVTL